MYVCPTPNVGLKEDKMQFRLLNDCPILDSCLDTEKIYKLLDTCNVKVGQIRDSKLLPDRIHVILKRIQH